MHLFHISQCSIQNRNVHISVLDEALWDMEQVHSRICEFGQFDWIWYHYNSLHSSNNPTHLRPIPWHSHMPHQPCMRCLCHHDVATVYPKKYAHGFVVLCFVVVMQSFIMNSHEVFIHIHQGCFAGTGAIVRLPQCQWSKPDGYGKISQCITTTKHSKAKTVCIFLGIYCKCNADSAVPYHVKCQYILE